MARRTLNIDGNTCTLAFDDYRWPGERLWAVAQGRLLDELTRRPVATPINVETEIRGLVGRTTSGGLVGLVGVPNRVFAYPDLAANAHDLHATLRAEGYLPYQVDFALGPIVNFPDVFAPANLGNIEMHREPVTIRGRVMQNGASPTPAAGSTVAIEAIWRHLPSATSSQAADPYRVVALSPGLYFPRRAVTARVRRRELIAVLGEDKALLEFVAAGSRRIRCSDRVNLASGDILAIDIGDSSIMEYVTIGAIEGASTAHQPAAITLDYSLKQDHRSGAVIRRVNAQAPGSDNPLSIDAIVGDVCVLLESATDLAAASTVEISDGGTHPNEYHRIFLFTTDTDARGYFRLPPLSRVAQLNLRIANGSGHSVSIDRFVPDYRGREHWLDVMI